jgi:hypothetical protein
MLQLPIFRMSRDEMIVDFRPNHAQTIELKEREKYYESLVPDYRGYVVQTAQPGMSWTGISRGKVVACFGVRNVWPGVGEAWMLPGTAIDRHAISLVRGARVIFSDLIKNQGFSRVHIVVDSANDSALRFAKAIGFEVEGIMRNFGPDGSNYYMMARIT